VTIRRVTGRKEDLELITPTELIQAANMVMGNIDLDPASSKVAQQFVQADQFFGPQQDGLNAQQWFGKVYLFPPSGCYFFDKKLDRWKMTRASSPTLVSSHAVWFRTLFKKWYADEVEQAIYFSNCPDMIRYEQKIFDFPICFLKTVPRLIKNTSEGIGEHKTCTSFVVHLQPKLNSSEATQKFIDVYEQFGRVIY
jgi:hypothetical protein